MAVSDPISDLFTCIRNANLKRKDSLEVFSSNIKEKILTILEKEGFIRSFKKVVVDKKTKFQIFLKYADDKLKSRVITGITRISKPGLRIYKKISKINKVRAGIGIAIISTSKGLVTDKEARKLNIGGEIIGYIW